MRRQNLVPSALVTVAIIAGFAWYGERTHAAPSRMVPPVADIVVRPIPTVEPDTAIEPNANDDRRKQQPVEAPYRQADTVAVDPPKAAFTQPMEPPPLPGVKEAAIATGFTDFSPQSVVLNPSDLDQMPVPKYQASPVYPSEMRIHGISGEVLVDFIVDQAGNVRNAVAARSSNREFEDAACNAVSHWRFTPGRRGGVAVSVHMQVPIVFSLGPGSS